MRSKAALVNIFAGSSQVILLIALVTRVALAVVPPRHVNAIRIDVTVMQPL